MESDGRKRPAARALAALVASPPTGPKSELYNSMGNAFARGFELAVTPALFALMGYALDRWIGIVPVLTIVLGLVAIIGMLLRTWYGYVYKMQALEEAGPWAKRR